ncbi:unnamed protein product, partial [Hymenolepis diminuta]
MTQRPQVSTNNPIEFGDDDEIGMEPSIASAAPALRSVTPSTASGISFQCRKKLKNSETITRRRRKRDKQISARSEEGKLREKRKSPANFNSSISVTKRRSNKRSTTGRPKREKAIAQTEIKSAPRKSKSTVKEDRSEAVNDILLQNEDMESKGGPRKIKMGIRDSSPRKATHILYTAESCLGDFKPPQQKKLTKSSSENCIPKIVIEKSENRKPSHAGKTEFKKKERDSIVKDDTYSDVELRSAVARIFKAV